MPHTFQGVTSCDLVHTLFSPPYDRDAGCIFNVLPSYQRDVLGHWCLLWYSKSEHCIFYVDPLGLLPQNPSIIKLLQQTRLPIYFSPIQIQGAASVFCGLHVIACLICFDRNLNLVDFFKLYSKTDFQHNDEVSAQVIKACLRQV